MMILFFLNKNRFGFTEIGNNVFISVDEEISEKVSNVDNNDLLIVRKNNQIDGDSNTYYYSSLVDKYIVEEGKVTVDKNNAFFVGDTLISRERVIGNKSFSIPLVGGFLKIMENKIGFILFVFLPIFIIFVYQVYQFIVDSNREKKMIIESTKNSYIDDEII